MSTTKQAGHVESAIGFIKWVIVALSIVTGVVYAVYIETATELTRTLELLALVTSALVAVSVWVSLGWMQHTLGMLTILARQGTLNAAPNLVIKSAGPAYGSFGGNSGIGGIHNGAVASADAYAAGSAGTSGRTYRAGDDQGDHAPVVPPRAATVYNDGDSAHP